MFGERIKVLRSLVKIISIVLISISMMSSSKPVFQNHLILSGKPGSGKSTIVEKVAKILKKEGVSFSGFYTKECRTGNSRSGFDIIDLNTNHAAPLARTVDTAKFKGPRVGKYVVDVESFEAAIKPIFSNFDNPTRILILDEIGKMELHSGFFQSLVTNLFKASPPFITLVTVPEKRDQFSCIQRICALPSSKIVEVNTTNRDLLPEILAEEIIQMHKMQIAST